MVVVVWCDPDGWWWCVPWSTRRNLMEGFGGCNLVWNNEVSGRGSVWVIRWEPDSKHKSLTSNSPCEGGDAALQGQCCSSLVATVALGKLHSSCSWWSRRDDGRRGLTAGAQATREHVFLKEESACVPLAGKKNRLKEFSSDKCHENTYAGICKAWNICSWQCFDHVVRLLNWYFHEISEILMAAGFLSLPFFFLWSKKANFTGNITWLETHILMVSINQTMFY